MNEAERLAYELEQLVLDIVANKTMDKQDIPMEILYKSFAELRRLVAINAELVEALELGIEIGDQCSRGFLAKFQSKAKAALEKAKQ